MSAKDAVKKGVGIVLWDILLPIRPIKTTAKAMLHSARLTADSAKALRDMADDARVTLAAGDGDGRDKVDGELTFDMMLASRPANALPLPELEAHFLSRKRLYLCCGAVLMTIAGVAVFRAFMALQAIGFLLSLASMGATCFLVFGLAFSSQFRLWQLRVRRLARSEQGGLTDYMAENRDWFWQTLDPEFKFRSGRQ